MDTTNQVIRLCILGTQAELERRFDDARSLFQQAWEARSDDYEACIAAHYVARYKETSEEMLNWNQAALDYANAVNDEQVSEFFPSLYLSLGRSYEMLGDMRKAESYYQLAAELGFPHQPD